MGNKFNFSLVFVLASVSRRAMRQIIQIHAHRSERNKHVHLYHVRFRRHQYHASSTKFVRSKAAMH